jgi:hypothetical protein
VIILKPTELVKLYFLHVLSALSCPSGLQTITGLLHLSFGYPHYQIPNVWLMAVLNKIFLK